MSFRNFNNRPSRMPWLGGKDRTAFRKLIAKKFGWYKPVIPKLLRPIQPVVHLLKVPSRNTLRSESKTILHREKLNRKFK